MTEIINNPLVCVCVPAYNAEGTIMASLRSILGQDYRNLKVILVDNASTDRTVAIARGLAKQDARLEIAPGKVNIGGEANFTRCIELACGDYTAIYHADDVYTPEIVREEAAFLDQHPNAGAVFTGAHEIDDNGAVIGTRAVPPGLAGDKPRVFAEVFAEVLHRGNYMIFPSALVRTAVYKNEIKAWNGAKYKTSADLDVWLRIAEQHPLGFIDQPLMNYRVSAASYSYNMSRLRTQRHDIFLVLQDYAAKYAGLFPNNRVARELNLLLLKDDINLAINQVIKGETVQARARLGGIFSLSALLGSLGSLLRLKILFYGYAAWLLSFLPLGEGGRKALAGIRHNG